MDLSRFSRIASIIVLGLVAPTARAMEARIWSDVHGLIAAPFCEPTKSDDVVDPRLNAFTQRQFSLDDGSVWTPLNVSEACLTDRTEKTYALFQVTYPNAAPIQIGVTGSEMALFAQVAPVASFRSKIMALDLPAGVEVQAGTLDYVVCITGPTLNVRDQSLSKVLFEVKRHASAKPVQSFTVDRQKKTIDGVSYTFVKAEFPQTVGAQKVGWVAGAYIKTRQTCPGATPPKPVVIPAPQQWTFPTILRPSTSYKEGMRAFRAGRSGGRLHAACDLYRVTGEQAVAITSGTVIRDKYYFYEGTYAIEVKHTGGRVARYGEITGKTAPNIALNKPVTGGQTVGYIGKVNSDCCTPMLHFELYSGTATGALSQSGNGFQRRKDLIDPSALLTEWEKAKFGKSY